MTRNKKNIFSLKKDKRYVQPNGLNVRSNLVPGLTYDRLIGKSLYLQAWRLHLICVDIIIHNYQQFWFGKLKKRICLCCTDRQLFWLKTWRKRTPNSKSWSLLSQFCSHFNVLMITQKWMLCWSVVHSNISFNIIIIKNQWWCVDAFSVLAAYIQISGHKSKTRPCARVNLCPGSFCCCIKLDGLSNLKYCWNLLG